MIIIIIINININTTEKFLIYFGSNLIDIILLYLNANVLFVY